MREFFYSKETHVRTSYRPRPAWHPTHLQESWLTEAAYRMIQNNLDPEVAEARRPGRLRRARTGRPQLGMFRRHPRIAEESRRRRDPAGSVRQAGGGVQIPPGRAARADRQLQPGAALGHLGAFRRTRRQGADHVRADDRRFVDLHRHAGHPAGHLRDLRRAGQTPGLGLAQGQIRA